MDGTDPHCVHSTRREFLDRALAAAVAVGSASLLPKAHAEATPRGDPRRSRSDGYTSNGDEARYPSRIGSFAKSLPHDDLGCAVPAAYQVLVRTLAEGPNADFEKIPLSGRVRLANPQAAYAFEKEGFDPHDYVLPPAPAFASAELAGEVAELHWHALLRDVPFAQYREHPLTNQAAAELSRFSDFRGPKKDGVVSIDTLFRGSSPGDLNGPYLSQFLLRDVPYGATKIVQRYKVPLAGDDHTTNYERWLNCQRGYFSPEASPLDAVPRYIRNGRDLGEYVRRDFSYQGFLNATLILLGEAYPRKSFRAPFSTSHPYLDSDTQNGFLTFGAPWVLDLVARVANLSLKATWFDKWIVHRKARPEEVCGHVHNHLTKRAEYPIHSELLAAPVLERIHEKTGSYLLPLAYPDGCPIHPSYPAGHATYSGACATVLKALFDETHAFPEPLVASVDGTQLQPYRGPALTVGGELNKLAANIAIGRDFAGVHWRSDGRGGLLQGEAVAIAFLKQQRALSPEKCPPWRFTGFSGQRIEI